MDRPTRQRTQLLQKTASKEGRAQASGRKLGKRAKRFKKWIEAHKPVVAAATE